MFKVIERHLPGGSHCSADDTQLYVSFKPDDANAQDDAICAMEDCIKDIRNWLIEGRLLLNDDKTEFLVIRTRQQLNKLNPSVQYVVLGPRLKVMILKKSNELKYSLKIAFTFTSIILKFQVPDINILLVIRKKTTVFDGPWSVNVFLVPRLR